MDYQNLPSELMPYKDKIVASEKPYIKVKATIPQVPLTPTQSKFGGIPFLLQSDDYPTTRAGKRLIHLAQFNFAELPKLDGFPTAGILQFFVEDNDLIGLNLNNQTQQDSFRVKYYPVEQVTIEKSIPDYDWPKPNGYFVLKRDFALTFSLERAPISTTDFRYDAILETQKHTVSLSTEAEDWYWNNCENTGHKLGGYPFFTQDDPRFEKEYKDYTTLLFQMDSDYEKEAKAYKTIWGDIGVANFFIKPDALTRLDFSDVLYNWDCS